MDAIFWRESFLCFSL